MVRIGLILSLLLFSLRCSIAQQTLIIKDSQIHYELTNQYFSAFKDSTNLLSEVNVVHQKFTPSDSYYGLVNDKHSTFWSKIELIDSSGIDKDWFFVFYNYSVDSLTFYVMLEDSIITQANYSVHKTKLSDKELKHKNFSVDLSVPKNQKITILLNQKMGYRLIMVMQ